MGKDTLISGRLIFLAADGNDSHFDDACGSIDLDDIANTSFHCSDADRRFIGDLAVFGICFGRADDLEFFVLIEFLVMENDIRAYADLIVFECISADDLSISDSQFYLSDLSFEDTLFIFSFIVLSVFGKVSEGTCFFQFFSYFGSADGNEVFEFFFKVFIALCGHFNFFSHIKTLLFSIYLTKCGSMPIHLSIITHFSPNVKGRCGVRTVFPRYEIPSVVGFGLAVALLLFRDMVMCPRKGYFSVLFVKCAAFEVFILLLIFR